MAAEESKMPVCRRAYKFCQGGAEVRRLLASLAAKWRTV
jgi:hypothetical protein